jgi:hypothetical protein
MSSYSGALTARHDRQKRAEQAARVFEKRVEYSTINQVKGKQGSSENRKSYTPRPVYTPRLGRMEPHKVQTLFDIRL